MGASCCVPLGRLAENRPKLLRGKTGTPSDDFRALASLVAEALDGLGWSGLNPQKIEIINLGGMGMGKTFKASAPGVEPAVVVLHWRGGGDPVIEAATNDAAQLFSSHGLAPRRLAQGGDWWIETFEGGTVGSSMSDVNERLASYSDLGALLAKTHSLPTTWFDVHRESICRRTPCLRDVPSTSLLWWQASYSKRFGDKRNDESGVKFAADSDWLPASTVLQKLVTSHGDFTPVNIVHSPNGLKVIDFEHTKVMLAAHDFACAVDNYLPTLEAKRSFARSYLETLKESAGAEEVDALVLDAECCSLTYSFGPVQRLWKAGQLCDELGWKVYDAYKAIWKNTRGDPELRQKVLNGGMRMHLECDKGLHDVKAEVNAALMSKLPPLEMAQPELMPIISVPVLPCRTTPQSKPYYPINKTSAQISLSCWLRLDTDQVSASPLPCFQICCTNTNMEMGDFQLLANWPLVGSSGGLHLDLIGNVVLGGGNSGTMLTFNYNVFNGDWRHVVMTYDADHNVAVLFVDGLQVMQKKLLAAFPVRLTTVCVGEQRPECKAQWADPFPHGQLRDVALYTRVLPLDEVSTIFGQGVSR